MKKLLLSLSLLLGLAVPALAQTPCVGVGGVNNVQQNGVNCSQEPAVATFAAASIGIAPASSPTDVVCLGGAANVVIRIQRVAISGSAATAIALPLQLTKNAVLDTAGTQATGTALPVAYSIDPGNAASAKATFQANTTNPTINDTSPGIIAVRQTNFAVTSSGSGSGTSEISWLNQRYAEAPTLRSAAQQVCVNLNAVTVSTGKLNTEWLWTEAAQ